MDSSAAWPALTGSAERTGSEDRVSFTRCIPIHAFRKGAASGTSQTGGAKGVWFMARGGAWIFCISRNE